VDNEFAANWQAMRDAGITRGAYHFFVTNEDAGQQAKLFLKTVGSLEAGDLPPVLDVEAESGTGANLVSDVQTWLSIVEQGLGRTPIIYTGPAFWNENMTGGFSRYPLWVAEYGVSAPKSVNGWSGWTFWQYSQSGSIAGVNGGVDLDYFDGSPADLAALCVPSNGETTTASAPPVNQPATTTATATTDAQAQTYTVRPGDTLGAIAAQLGTTVNALCQSNGITDPNEIEVGQVLTIP
jgi:lysozyme